MTGRPAPILSTLITIFQLRERMGLLDNIDNVDINGILGRS